MRAMRAKMYVSKVELHGSSEVLHFNCVGRKDAYPADGSDENNTFAKFSPSGDLRICVTNPALLGNFRPGDTFYVDFEKTTS